MASNRGSKITRHDPRRFSAVTLNTANYPESVSSLKRELCKLVAIFYRAGRCPPRQSVISKRQNCYRNSLLTPID
ncbi:hypothetical protein CF645_29105 [Burkholderia pseudomallei]|nr:hypothetical protein CF640_24640 [Burkholderia pseudomallei]PNX18664.1 hypothetical protein CF645_29105 [Burkholderia pseudomallei]